MPWIGRTRAGHVFNVALLCVLLGGAALLTAQAIHDDYYAAWHEKPSRIAAADVVAKVEASQRFLEAKEQAEREAERVIELATSPERIPPDGALAMVYDDPLFAGAEVV